jgi:hypothetical protein
MTNKKQATGKLNRKGNRRGMHVGPHRFKKGLQRSPQAGRKKGVRNKLTLICREALATCFESIGGVEGLVAWAAKNDAVRLSIRSSGSSYYRSRSSSRSRTWTWCSLPTRRYGMSYGAPERPAVLISSPYARRGALCLRRSTTYN